MSKRQKLNVEAREKQLLSLGRASFVSKSGIAKLLAAVKEEGLPDTFDRSAQYRARKNLANSETPYGKIVSQVEVRNKDGTTQNIGFQNPLAFMAYHCQESPHYAEIVRMALEKKPCTPASPWNLIIYQDGVDPSDGLAKNHSRKSAVFYWSFAEFGLHALAHEEVWGCVTVMRSIEAAELDGSLGQLTARVLEQFFGDVHDIRRTGVSVRLKNVEPHHIFAEIGILLADEPALKEMTDCKGHAGHKPCLLCMDCSNHNLADPLHQRSSYFKPMCLHKLSDFKQHTDETIRQTVRNLHASHDQYKSKQLRQYEYEEKSQVAGWNYNPSGIILNERFRLRLASCVMFDWAHTYVCDGLADTELGQCMKILHSNRTSTTYAELGEYVNTFTFPKETACPKHLFTEASNRNNARKGSFTSTASEFLTLAPVLYRYFTNVVKQRNQFMPYVLSMIAVLNVVMLLQSVKTGEITPERLFIAITEHLILYTAAYGEGACRPKHHYCIHLPDMLRRFGFLLATFTHERKHRIVIRYTKNRYNLKSWALGAIEDITSHQVWELGLPFFMAFSTSKPRGKMFWALHELFPGVPDACFSLHTQLKCNGGRCCNGDVISCLVDGVLEVGELLMTVGLEDQEDLSMFCILSIWKRVPSPASDEVMGWVAYETSDDRVAKAAAANVDTVFTYRMADNGQSCMLYLPCELRPTG